ncbi:TetR family transcriptional regulator [Jatrophihabitans sp. GAS493]|uniref:TetR/AcrR family transcriptional regulator n=1 Tax=Jatrophihabitans sp. GAS493 TaxID=1907575 RepID=UPI000BB80CD2|nr:TetR/AcrR family transcriptional regulator [Jatrophihabitans sp. GAS493]SOD73145.1 TetR family transcriptional regulator [Jatrophihabitans sp. GAS493]
MPSAERRSERSRTEILTAALDLAIEVGYSSLTIEGIARRAGVGKQTIYRWWPSKAAVLLEALLERATPATAVPDTADLRADLRAHLRTVGNRLSSKDMIAYRALIAAAQSDPEVATQIQRTLIRPRVEACHARLEAALKDGVIRADVDLDQVIEMLYAPLYYRFLLQTQPIDDAQTDAVINLLMPAIQA